MSTSARRFLQSEDRLGDLEGGRRIAIAVIGLDLAKKVFLVHGADAARRTVLSRRLRCGEVVRFFAGLPRALVGVEAWRTVRHRGRGPSRLGHDVRLTPPQSVTPYVKSRKNDAADAEAICGAVARPAMRFVPVKGAEQQAVGLLHSYAAPTSHHTRDATTLRASIARRPPASL